MERTTNTHSLNGCAFQVSAPVSDGLFPVIYLQDGEELLPMLQEMSAFHDAKNACIVVAITPPNRDDNYTPWPAPALFSKANAFTGKASDFLALTEQIKQYVDTHYPTLPNSKSTAQMGISLSGLFCLWAGYQSTSFGVIASVSGSLWYEGFFDYATSAKLLPENPQVFLSLGRGESKGRNPMLRRVGEVTEQLYSYYANLLGDEQVALSVTDGGHTAFLQERLETAFQWTLQKIAAR